MTWIVAAAPSATPHRRRASSRARMRPSAQMPAQGRIATALLSNVGRVRSNNEDVVEVDPELGLLILADGMGGHNAGEVASALAVATTLEIVRGEWPNLQHGEIDPASGPSRAAQLLLQALLAAHAKI